MTGKHQLNLLVKPLLNSSSCYTTLLESDHDIVAYQVSDLISYDIRTVDRASDWLLVNFSTVKCNVTYFARSLDLITANMVKWCNGGIIMYRNLFYSFLFYCTVHVM